MIRLLHTSDWHLGRTLYGHSLHDDQTFFLERLLELVDKTKPHGLIIAGDIFDRTLPPESAVSLFDHFLNEAAGKRGLPLFIIPGNHDSCERVGYAARLLKDRGVSIFAKVEDSFSPVLLKGDSGAETLIYGIPFVEPLLIGRHLGREDLRSPDLAIGALCRELLEKKPKNVPAVLLCHAFVTGSEVSDSEKEIYIGGSSQVDARAFEGFAYTALGHLHKPQRAGRENVRYSGSPLPYSKSETGHQKSITEVLLQSNSAIEIKEHRLPLLRALRYVEGELDVLLKNGLADQAREDYIIAGYTDDGAVLEAYSKLRAAYPNLLHVSRAGGFSPDRIPALEKAKAQEALNELDLFSDFFRDATGADLNEKEKTLLIEVIGELEKEGLIV